MRTLNSFLQPERTLSNNNLERRARLRGCIIFSLSSGGGHWHYEKVNFLNFFDYLLSVIPSVDNLPTEWCVCARKRRSRGSRGSNWRTPSLLRVSSFHRYATTPATGPSGTASSLNIDSKISSKLLNSFFFYNFLAFLNYFGLSAVLRFCVSRCVILSRFGESRYRSLATISLD